jgi:hypothetical protein
MKTVRLPFALLFLCGCSSSTHDELIKQQIGCLEEAAEILESVTDFASAGAARPKLKKIVARIEEQNARGRALPAAPADELRKLAEQNQAASGAALKRLNDAARKASEYPDCADVVGEFGSQLGRLLNKN